MYSQTTVFREYQYIEGGATSEFGCVVYVPNFVLLASVLHVTYGCEYWVTSFLYRSNVHLDNIKVLYLPNRCTLYQSQKTLKCTIKLTLKLLLHVSVHDHHQGAYIRGLEL